MDATGAADAVTSAVPTDARHWWAGHEDALPATLDWLSTRERTVLEVLRFTKRRNEFLLRRWVGKQTVATRTGMDADPDSLARIEVLNRQSGAPYIAIDGREAPWEVSLSDRAGVAIAVIGAPGAGDRGALGIDLELVEPRSEGFVTDFLTPAEQDWVRGPAAADPRLGQDAAANLLWSAKEAALKVLRLGLRADTRSVEVTVGSDQVGAGWCPLTVVGHDTVMVGWWRRDGVFLLTVAAQEHLDPPTLLPGSTVLTSATPVHSWVRRPLVTPWEQPPSPAR